MDSVDPGRPRRTRAEACRQNFTKYPRWTDDQGRSRPASEHDHYNVWKHARARCHNPRHERYESYGGRGIRMHPEWLADPTAFFAWVDANLGKRPKGTSLDRIDNSKGYEPQNLRWADAAVQANNRRPAGAGHPDPCLCAYPDECGGEVPCVLDDLPWPSARRALMSSR